MMGPVARLGLLMLGTYLTLGLAFLGGNWLLHKLGEWFPHWSYERRTFVMGSTVMMFLGLSLFVFGLVTGY